MKASLREPLVRTVVKHPWLTAGALGSIIAIGAALVLVSGITPIKASSGHWAITAHVLDFAKVRSVTTYSLNIEPPPLDDETLLLRGAGHYDLGCYPCHGGPGGVVPPVMAAMTPAPPPLTGGQIARWDPEELFTIVKHGIKFTGMPAWPVLERDDEVWAIVAFLRRMGSLDATGYRRLAYGDAAAAPDAAPLAVRELCWRCHGVDGTGRGPGGFPSLAGQRSGYLYASLRAFADRTRFSGIMRGIATNLSDSAMREIAAYYERLPLPASPKPRSGEGGRVATPPADAAAIARGADIANRGVAARDIPACVECHGPASVPKNPAYPTLSGQHAPYLRLQLDLLQARHRGGSPNVNLMHAFVDRLSQEQIADVTQYFSSLGTITP